MRQQSITQFNKASLLYMLCNSSAHEHVGIVTESGRLDLNLVPVDRLLRISMPGDEHSGGCERSQRDPVHSDAPLMFGI